MDSRAGRANSLGSRLWIVAVLTQAHRGNSEQAANMVGEMTLVGKAGFHGNLADGQLSFAQECLGAVHPPPDHILMKGHSDGLAKRRIAVRNGTTLHATEHLE